MQEKHNSKEEQETTEKTRAIENTAKSLQGIQPDTVKASAAAAEQAAGIPQEYIQAAEQTVSNMPLQEDFDAYINAIVNATSFADMTETEKAVYLQSVKELNAQLKGNIEKLQRLVNLENYNNALLSQQLLNGTILQVYETLDGILTFYQSKTWAYFSKLFPDMADYFAGTTVQQETYLDTFFLLDFCHKLEAAEPFASAELEAYKKRTGKEAVTFKEFQKEVLPLCLEQAQFSENIAEKKEQTLSLRATRPENYIIPNTIVSNSMHKGLINAGKQPLDASKNHQGKYFVYTEISLDPNKYAVTGETFTKHDRRVLNGICSLWAAGNMYFTSDMVYRAINSLQESEYVSPQSRAAVTKSIEKMASIIINIDATEEFEKRHITDYEGTFFGNCIYIKGVKIHKKNSNDVAYTVYNILEQPILYQYAQYLHQVIEIPIKELAIKDVVKKGNVIVKIEPKGPNNSEHFRAIIEYLLTRIEQMKSRKKRTGNYEPTILLSDFYTETETRTDNSKYTSWARGKAEQCLDYWKADGYIKDYAFIGKRPVKSIEIYLQ